MYNREIRGKRSKTLWSLQVRTEQSGVTLTVEPNFRRRSCQKCGSRSTQLIVVEPNWTILADDGTGLPGFALGFCRICGEHIRILN